MANGFTLLKFTNAIKCNTVLDGQSGFVGGQIYSLQRTKPNLDPVKENHLSVLLWIRLPRLPLEMWNENILSKILKPIGRLIKLDPNFEEISKGLFVRVCLEVDVSKPLKMNKSFMDDSIYECFIDYENITNVCYGCGSDYHKFDTCYLNSKSVSFKVERL